MNGRRRPTTLNVPSMNQVRARASVSSWRFVANTRWRSWSTVMSRRMKSSGRKSSAKSNINSCGSGVRNFSRRRFVARARLATLGRLAGGASAADSDSCTSTSSMTAAADAKTSPQALSNTYTCTYRIRRIVSTFETAAIRNHSISVLINIINITIRNRRYTLKTLIKLFL